MKKCILSLIFIFSSQCLAQENATVNTEYRFGQLDLGRVKNPDSYTKELLKVYKKQPKSNNCPSWINNFIKNPDRSNQFFGEYTGSNNPLNSDLKPYPADNRMWLTIDKANKVYNIVLNSYAVSQTPVDGFRKLMDGIVLKYISYSAKQYSNPYQVLVSFKAITPKKVGFSLSNYVANVAVRISTATPIASMSDTKVANIQLNFDWKSLKTKKKGACKIAYPVTIANYDHGV